METIEMYNITYEKPKVTLLQESGLGVAEIAARTCYDSFENSENQCIKEAMEHLDTDAVNAIDRSDLLANLAWVHHHHSIIEHATLSFLIQGTSRGVLQEHARHRLQAISVSTLLSPLWKQQRVLLSFWKNCSLSIFLSLSIKTTLP